MSSGLKYSEATELPNGFNLSEFQTSRMVVDKFAD
jgi:hypothetical protein